MGRTSIDQLIVNSPYEEPTKYWRYDRQDAGIRLGHRAPLGRLCGGVERFPSLRRPRCVCRNSSRQPNSAAGQGVARRRVSWRDGRDEAPIGALERPGGVREPAVFLLPIGAAETLIWLTEAPAAERVGVELPSDGGTFARLCAKMATGAGKTVVMAMVIAWHVLNKATYPQDPSVYPVRPGDCSRSHRQEPAGRARPIPSGELPHRVPHRAIVPARQAAPRHGGDPQLARAQLGKRTRKLPGSAAWTSVVPRATTPMPARCWAT